MSRLDAAMRAELATIVGEERLSLAPAVRAAHGQGEGMGESHPPDGVVFARSSDEVARIVELCAAHRVPVIPFGAGSSLEGHLHAIHGGVSLDLSGMDRVLAVSADDLDCHVEAGVTREALNLELRHQGLFFPLDPGANATLGGMAATRASGTNAVRYGTMRDVTLGLTVVTAEGDIIRTGGRARKSSAGYDLTRLYIGSEGTLGIITELRLRLFGIPEEIAAAVVQFEDLAAAVATVTLVLQTGIPVARIELLDEVQTAASIAWSKLSDLKPLATLFLEFHGSPAEVAGQMEAVAAIANDMGGGAMARARSPEARNRLWKARHEAYWAARGLKPGCDSFATDACVPISALPEVIAGARADAAAAGLLAPIVGHVGDGNFHALLLFDPADPGERARADAVSVAIARRAIAAGGTATGEHGVGRHKLGLLAEEHGEGAVAVMRRVKQALDPLGILNPGKTVPEAGAA
jgi:D-lactate dehydrogenase (cytochrome)